MSASATVEIQLSAQAGLEGHARYDASVPAASPTPPAAATVTRTWPSRVPGRVRVDMHMHTMWSGDATTTPEELVAAVAETQHRRAVHHRSRHDQRRRRAGRPARVPRRRRPGGAHLGGRDHRPVPHRAAAVRPQARGGAWRITAQGGLVYIPHPFDPMRACMKEEVLVELVGDGLVDAIEVFNAKTSLEHLNDRAARVRGRQRPGRGRRQRRPRAVGDRRRLRRDARLQRRRRRSWPPCARTARRRRATTTTRPARGRPRIVPSTKST